jgi:hypothetical protein
MDETTWNSDKMDETTWHSDLNISSDGGGEIVNNEFKHQLKPK